MKLSDIHLVVFLTRAIPLSRWEELGMLNRELAIYRRLADKLGSCSLVSYGGREELEYQDRIPNIEILYNRWHIPANIYSLFIPLVHRRSLRQANVYRTNQFDGAWTAVLAGAVYRKPVILRAGYLWAENNRKEGHQGFKANLIDRLQEFSLKRADHIVLTTQEMRHSVIEKYHLPPEKVKLIPNFVDTNLFRPDKSIKKIPGRVCFIGRLHPSKNLNLVIDALSEIPGALLVLIGQGEQKRKLEKQAKNKQVQVTFTGSISHEQIPFEINQSEIFILPSAFEGHPKALIEAMACGVSVIGSNVEGIRELIQHEQTGILCPSTAEEIKKSIVRLLNNQQLRERLGDAAHAFVEREFSLEKVLELELMMIHNAA